MPAKRPNTTQTIRITTDRVFDDSRKHPKLFVEMERGHLRPVDAGRGHHILKALAQPAKGICEAQGIKCDRHGGGGRK